MDERIVQFRVGATVLAALILTAILVVLLGEFPSLNLSGPPTQIYIYFPEAPGVSVDTPVRKSGKRIGRVTAAEFAEEMGFDDPGIIVTASIDPRVKLRRSEVCRIRSSLLGDAELQFVPGTDPDAPKTLVKDGDLLRGVVMTDPLEIVAKLEGNLTQTIMSVTGTSDEIGRLARQVNDLLANNQEQVSRIVGKAEQTLDTIGSLSNNLNSLLDDAEMQANLKKSINEMPEILTQARDAVEGIRTTIELADRNLQNIEGFTKPLGERGGELIARIDSTLTNVNRLFTDLSGFTQALSTSEGTVGQLLNNPALYQNINEAAENLVDLTRSLRPIVHDARVTMDKIARDPGGEVGVRGVLKRRSGIK